MVLVLLGEAVDLRTSAIVVSVWFTKLVDLILVGERTSVHPSWWKSQIRGVEISFCIHAWYEKGKLKALNSRVE